MLCAEGTNKHLVYILKCAWNPRLRHLYVEMCTECKLWNMSVSSALVQEPWHLVDVVW